MMSDYIWDLLEPATEGFECVNREEVQQGLDEGEFTLFEGLESDCAR